MLSKNQEGSELFGDFCGETIGEGHKLVDDDQSDAEASAKSEDLVTNGITKSNRAIGFFIHDLGHSDVGNHLTSTFEDVSVQISKKVGWDV